MASHSGTRPDSLMADAPSYETIMVVPARGGSKSIPGKNIKPLAGRPLAVWCIEAGLGCETIDRVILATDDAAIAETVASHIEDPRFEIFRRSDESATDTAPSEHVIIEVLDRIACRRVVMVQPTSPLLRAEDLRNGLARMDADDADSVVSVVRQKRFIWKETDQGMAVPLNYNPQARPRRQDFDGLLVENGAFYITDAAGFRNTGSRLFGHIVAQEMPEESYVELDEPSDWAIVEAILQQRQPSPLSGSNSIALVLSDIDGVLTDAGMYYGEAGDELKKFCTYDGLGIARLKQAGFRVGLITREDRALNRRRAEKLGVDFIEQGATDKVVTARRWLDHYGLSWANVAYIGDDLHDIPLLERVGLAAAPANAFQEVKAVSRFVGTVRGGNGALREFADYLLAGTDVGARP